MTWPTWTTIQQNFELFLMRARYVCAILVPVFYGVNEIWSFVSSTTANKIVGTFVALGFITGGSVKIVTKNKEEQK